MNIEASSKVAETLRAALLFHKRRDEMNAMLHLAAVCYSPLTMALKEALAIYENGDDA